MSRPVLLPSGEDRVLWQSPHGGKAQEGSLMFGSSLADVFRTPDYDCRVVDANQRPEFAVTRLRSGPREMEKAPAYLPDKAVLICVSLTPASIGQWRALYSGRHDVASDFRLEEVF